MKKKVPTVNIIGGGVGALMCAAALSREGIKVNIFERFNQAGGIVRSFNCAGYQFEASTHQICGLTMENYLAPYLRRHGITGPEYVKMPELYESIFCDGDKMADRYILPAGKEALRARLLTYFPGSAKAINRHLHCIEKIGQELLRLKRIGRIQSVVEGLPRLWDILTALCLQKGKGLFRTLGEARYRELVTNWDNTYKQMIRDLDPALQSVISAYATYFGTSATEVSGLALSLAYYLYGLHAPCLIKGGTEQLIKKLVAVIERQGGKFFFNTPVKKVMIEAGKATGVVAFDNQIYPGDFIVSDISTKKLFFELMDPGVLPAPFRETISRLELSPSAFQVYIGSRLAPEEYGFQAGTTFFNFDMDPLINYSLSLKGPTAGSPFAMTSYSFHRHEAAPARGRKASLVIFEFDNYRRWENLSKRAYQLQKDKIQQLILDKVEKITSLPIRKKADIIFSATPKTFQHYLGNTEGEILGPAGTVGQALTRRTPFITPVPHLLLVGAYTQPCGGISGCLDSGLNAAFHILKA